MDGFHRFAIKNPRMIIKIPRIAGGKKFETPVLTALRFHFGMTVQIISQAFCHDTSLRNKLHVFGAVLMDAFGKQGIMGTSKQYRIYFLIFLPEIFYMLFYEIISARR